jgi:hypothetical protein
MLKNLIVAIMLLCLLSNSAAATVSIGTVSARGEMRVDTYAIKGNATLFDGSVIETGQAAAELRLAKGTEITLSAGSRGTLYRDHLVLQQGESELATATSFQLQANGLRVTPNQPDSRGLVSISSAKTVDVTAFTGSFAVTNNQGVLLASVHPGLPVSFAMQADGTTTSTFTATGKISFENGHYYLTDSKTGIKYEVTGQDLSSAVGKTVKITGTFSGVVSVTSAQVLTAGVFTTTGLIITSVVVVAAAGTAVGVYFAVTPSTPASR